MPKNLAIFLLLAVFATADAPLALAQRKPYDTGNCFQWKGCRGDSIGALWTVDPDRCKAIGGKSWSDETDECYNLPDGAQVVIIPFNQSSRTWPK